VPAATHLTQGTTSGASPASPSFTPTANRPVLVAIAIYTSGGTPTVNSVTGNGITYAHVLSATAIDDGFGPYRLHLYRGLSASPSTGSVTASLSASADQVDFAICEWSGADATGTNGENAIVQSATSTTNEGTTLTVTLGAFAASANATYGCMVSYDDVPITPGTGFTELDDATQLQTQWRADNDTSVTWTWDGVARDTAGIAVEIKAAGATGPGQMGWGTMGAGDMGPNFGDAATAVTGTLSASLPLAIASISGTAAGPVFTGTLAASAPLATASISGTVTGPVTGTLDASVPRATSTISGTAAGPVFTGTLSASAPLASSTISGTAAGPVFTGTLSAAVPLLTGSIAGTVAAGGGAETGTLAASLPLPTASISGTVAGPVFTGTLAASVPRVTSTIAGDLAGPWTGTLLAQSPLLTSTIAGTRALPEGAGGFQRQTHGGTGGFERLSSTGGEWTRINSTADPFERTSVDRDNGFERLDDDVGSGFQRV
jgi:hypothetical protein